MNPGHKTAKMGIDLERNVMEDLYPNHNGKQGVANIETPWLLIYVDMLVILSPSSPRLLMKERKNPTQIACFNWTDVLCTLPWHKLNTGCCCCQQQQQDFTCTSISGSQRQLNLYEKPELDSQPLMLPKQEHNDG